MSEVLIRWLFGMAILGVGVEIALLVHLLADVGVLLPAVAAVVVVSIPAYIVGRILLR